MRCGQASERAPQGQPARHLAKGNVEAPGREAAEVPEKSTEPNGSSEFPFVFVEKAAKFGDFLFRAAMAGKGVQHKLAGGAIEDALEGIRGKLAFCLFGREAGFVNVGALFFIAADQALGSHDLHQFQDGGVAELSFFGKSIVHIAHGGRSAIPKHVENIEFGSGGFLRYRHGREDTTKNFVMSTKIFVHGRQGGGSPQRARLRRGFRGTRRSGGACRRRISPGLPIPWRGSRDSCWP